MIASKEISANLEFALVADSRICLASFFGRSLAGVRSISASLTHGNMKVGHRSVYKPSWLFQSYIQPLALGKDRFYHCIAYSEAFGKELFLTLENQKEEDFYNYLMHNYDYPLLGQWSATIFQEAVKKRHIKNLCPQVIRGEHAVLGPRIAVNGQEVDLGEAELYLIEMSDGELEKIISDLLKRKFICISEKEQQPLDFQGMDQYFERYGKTLVSNLEGKLNPLVPLDGNCRHLAFKQIRLMPPQAAQVNGLVKLLTKSKYAILNMGMGTGKTITSIAAAEGFFNAKKGGTLKEIYTDPNAVAYRNVVMCPGHLVEKWAKEIRQQVPYAEVAILTSFSQLVEIKKTGKERKKREWYIIGKDFAKLGYQSIPVPKRAGYKPAYALKCKDCGEVSMGFQGKKRVCRFCGSASFELARISGKTMEGMVCPFCRHLLLENKNDANSEDEEGVKALTGISFTVQNSRNSYCNICGERLWQPYVENLFLPGEKKKEAPWYQVTHYSNKAHKAKKTVWVHEAYAEDYFKSIQETPLQEKRGKGIRKYPPASYVKKKLKGFFDFLILDEAHLYKGGATAQGNAMHAFVKSSKKVMALTGTIAGGMANDLFYLLYRLDPARMIQHGYGFHNEMKFTEKYGAMESVYEVEAKEGEYNKASRGKQIQGAKPKPGISPLIFGDFLLDKAVFLDLTDMSEALPPYKEIVELIAVPKNGPKCDLEEGGSECAEQLAYRQVLQSLKEKSKKSLGKSILGTMLQFALSYPDKPYGVPDIIHPYDGSVLEKIPDFRVLVENGRLLAKEARLVDVVKEELEEGRNCVIYAEYTGNPATCVTHRLKEILVANTCLLENEVAILEASYPPTAKREAWMHKRAEEGVRVFVTNPKCVETGLDFIWEKDGRVYNYPTLIFYQMGYSLFTVWQASRRAYRLIQKEECRTYYFAYAETLQQMVIQLIAEKRVATAAIQGKFSAEGISAMANGVDTRVRLAQAMSGKDMGSKDLQAMFRTAFENNAGRGYQGISKMPIVSEIIGDGKESLMQNSGIEVLEVKEEQDYFTILHNLDGLFCLFQGKQEGKDDDSPDPLEKGCLNAVREFVMLDELAVGEKNAACMEKKLSRKEEKAKRMGQVSLFGFY